MSLFPDEETKRREAAKHHGWEPAKGAPTLRQYQHDALEGIVACYIRGINRVLVKMPTGTGKTVMFAELLKQKYLAPWLADHPTRKKGARLLVIAHREELLDQAAEKIRAANPGIIVTIEQGDRFANRYSDVVVASIQTLGAMKFRRLDNLLRWHGFPIVLIDEAHHAAAATYRNALVRLGFLPPADASDVENIEAANYDDVEVMERALLEWDKTSPKDRLLIGVTATPNRSDAVGLGCVFQEIAYSYDLKTAIEDGWLTPIVPWVIETDVDLSGIKVTAGDFNQKELAKAVNVSRRNELAVAAWREHADGIPTIAFTVDIAHAHEMAAAFAADGVKVRPLSGETPREDRRQILDAFKRGELEVVTNCMVLTEGTDLPIAGCILHGAPTKSATLYEQKTGRGLRPFKGKPHCIVIDLVDVSRKHSLMQAPILYGLPPGIKTHGELLDDVERELLEILERRPGFDVEELLKSGALTLEQLHARSITFDVWTKQPLTRAVQEASTMGWIRTGDTYRIQYPWSGGLETLVVSKDVLGKWDLSATIRSSARVPGTGKLEESVRSRTLAHGLPSAEAAVAAAELYCASERRSVLRLKDREAAWRRGEPSEGQLRALQALNVPVRRGITRGDASDLIDFAKGRLGR